MWHCRAAAFIHKLAVFQFAVFQIVLLQLAAPVVAVATEQRVRDNVEVLDVINKTIVKSVSEPTISDLTLVAPSGALSELSEPLEWCGYPGNTLRGMLQTWATTANWTLQWRFPHDYPISITTCFHGEFTQVLQQLANAYQWAESSFYLDLYSKQRLLVVSS